MKSYQAPSHQPPANRGAMRIGHGDGLPCKTFYFQTLNSTFWTFQCCQSPIEPIIQAAPRSAQQCGLRPAIVNAASAFSLLEIAHNHKQLPCRKPQEQESRGHARSAPCNNDKDDNISSNSVALQPGNQYFPPNFSPGKVILFYI